VVNIITVSQDKGCTDAQETLPNRPADMAPGQRKWSFDRLRKDAINEVREQLFSSKPSGIPSRKRSSQSAVRAAMLVPALVGTSVILSAPASPTGERRQDLMFSAEARDTISSYENNSQNQDGHTRRRYSWPGN
jgi:hypothetical protein